MNSKDKGKRGELELSAFLRERGYEQARRGQQYSGGGDSPDVVGVDGAHIECKRTEHCKPYDFVAQARNDSAGTGRLPIVAFRRNRGEWLAILDLGEMIDLFTFAKEHGYEYF